MAATHSPFVPAEAETQTWRRSSTWPLGPRFRGDERPESLYKCLHSSSRHQEPAVDMQRLAGDVAEAVAGKRRHHLRDVAWRSRMAERDAVDGVVRPPLGGALGVILARL